MILERVIVLSWIQNFLQRFIKDSETEYDVYGIHRNKQEKSLPNMINEGVKDLNTRISYQYPKGKLLSPVIREEKWTKTELPIRKKRVEQPIESKKSEPLASQGIIKEVPKKRNEESLKRSRPFEPTQIPSPVFGFNRPASSLPNAVEHELSHFFDDEIEENSSFIIQEEAATIEIEHISMESPPDSPADSHPDSIPDLHPDSPSDSHPDSIPDSHPDSPSDSHLDSLPEENVTIQSEPLVEERSEEEIIQHSEAHRPKRAHLPFNVMMLKQDKLKWEESKRRRRREQQETTPEPVVQAEKPKENVQPEPELKEPMNSIENKITSYPEWTVHEEEAPKLSDDLYVYPSFSLLNPPIIAENNSEWVMYQEELLNQTLQNFNVGAKVVNVTQGPSVTRFEVQPEPGVKVNKITNLSDDIKLSLAAKDIRIEAPIPGKHTIGIEVPNEKSRPVFINEIIQSSVFQESGSPLTAVLGLDISGKPIVTDLKKMPHGLIAGATGSGKSVCINTILVSLLFKASPEDLKLLLIDPKMVELAPYNRIPHLVSPVITDVKAATAALKWAVEEMERRYELFAHTGVRDINRFNEMAIKHKQYADKLPFIVIIIDELADLMMMSPADVEEAICRIAQKARACGIHLIVATQRPSVDVITGLIKANIPTRIAFSVSSQVDSRTIIDISGAEKLLGRGDMLFLENGSSKPVRLQGTFVSDEEIDLVVGHVREQREPQYLFEQEELLKKAQISEDEDELFYDACEFIIEQGVASTSSLQRRFKIGYNRAARLMDMLETNGFITSANGSKPREVLITEADLESLQDTGTIN